MSVYKHEDMVRCVSGTMVLDGIELSDVAMCNINKYASGSATYRQIIDDIKTKYDRRTKMDTYSEIQITFKSGNTVSFGSEEWDDYSYDGKSIAVKKSGAWIAIYNFADVFSVELR